MRIAIFDSGIGGLTVLKEALAALPSAEYIYYADSKNFPYGVKKKQEVIEHVVNAFDFLAEKNIQIAVVACNTATSVAISELRKRYQFPIIGMEPAIKPAITGNAGKKILVLATSLTLRESKLEELIRSLDREQRIHKKALDNLVVHAERLDFDSAEIKQYLKQELGSIDFSEYETIVLGCTHFIYYSKAIEGIVGKNIKIIDGNAGTVKNLVMTIQNKISIIGGKYDRGRLTFYSSGIEDSTDRVNRLLEIVKQNKQSITITET